MALPAAPARTSEAQRLLQDAITAVAQIEWLLGFCEQQVFVLMLMAGCASSRGASCEVSHTEPADPTQTLQT
jgi:hypothetical protein